MSEGVASIERSGDSDRAGVVVGNSFIDSERGKSDAATWTSGLRQARGTWLARPGLSGMAACPLGGIARGALMVTDHAQHGLAIRGETGKRAQRSRHFGGGGIGFSAQQGGDGRDGHPVLQQG